MFAVAEERGQWTDCLVGGTGISFWSDANVLELNSGDGGCTALWMY